MVTEALNMSLKEKLLAISPAQMDRLLQPARVRHPRKGFCTTQPGTLLRQQVPTRGGPPDTSKPGSVEADTMAHCGDTTAGDYVNSLTFTELFIGWTENRAVWNKSSHAIQVKQKDKAGRPAIGAFEAMMMREDCEKGFFVSFDYSSDALQEIESFFKRSHKVIVALTASWRLGASAPSLARPHRHPSQNT